VTVLSIVPVVLEGIAKLEALPNNKLRYIFVGGDRVSNEQIDKVQQLLTSEQQIIQRKLDRSFA
jgi:hypothetical protein